MKLSLVFGVACGVVSLAGALYLMFFCGWRRYDPNPPRLTRVRMTTPVGNYGYWLDEGPPSKPRPTADYQQSGPTASL